VLVAVAVGGGLLVAGGTIPVPKMRTFPGLESWAILGLIPLAGAAAMAIALRSGNRRGFVYVTAIASVAFVGLVSAFPSRAMDDYKAPRELVRSGGIADPTRDVRLAAYDWFQPSVVFYSQRHVEKLPSVEKAAEFLAVPTPGYLFVEEPTWNDWIANQVTVPHHVAAKHFDFYRNKHVLVIANSAAFETARAGK
jgi:hypothetical protein